MCKSIKETYSELLIRVRARFPIPFAAQLFIILVLYFYRCNSDFSVHIYIDTISYN